MQALPAHHCRVFGSPWDGVYGTQIESSRHYGRHSHTVYGLGLIEDGAQSSASGRGQVDAYAGDLITTNPGEVHDGRPLGGPSRRWRMLYLDPAVWAEAAPDMALTRPVISDLPLRSVLLQLFRRLEAWHAAPARCAANALACDESLTHTMALVRMRHCTGAAPVIEADACVVQARDRLADGLLDPPSLTELAALAGLGKFQLLRRFKAVHGVTPYAWLLQQRAERARGLIRQGAGLAPAAAGSGFADQSHMTRVFVRQFGFTPGAWQKAAAQPARLQ